MKRSTERILVSHAGSLARPTDLRDMIVAKENDEPYDAEKLETRLKESVAEVVRDQITNGIDIVNDGEFGKGGFSQYARVRLSGLEQRNPGARPGARNITGRDQRDFPEFFEMGAGNIGGPPRTGLAPTTNQPVFCVGPLKYIGQDEIKRDIENFKLALQSVEVVECVGDGEAAGGQESYARCDRPHHQHDRSARPGRGTYR